MACVARRTHTRDDAITSEHKKATSQPEIVRRQTDSITSLLLSIALTPPPSLHHSLFSGELGRSDVPHHPHISKRRQAASQHASPSNSRRHHQHVRKTPASASTVPSETNLEHCGNSAGSSTSQVETASTIGRRGSPIPRHPVPLSNPARERQANLTLHNRDISRDIVGLGAQFRK